MLSSTVRGIFAEVARQASDQLSNNGCNDFPVDVTDKNREHLKLFIEDYAQDEEHLESLSRQLVKGKIWFQDDMLMTMLAKNLESVFTL